MSQRTPDYETLRAAQARAQEGHVQRVECDSHHWVSTNVPGLLIRWVIQCSICEAYNVEEMNTTLLKELAEERAAAWGLGMWTMYNTTSSEWPPIPEQNPFRQATP